MKTLLLNYFTSLYNKDPGTIPVNEQYICGNIGLKDYKACQSCKPFFAITCEHEVFKISSETTISQINIEDFIDSFNIKGRKCDYLLYDTTHLVLADLTCSMEEYLYPHLQDGEKQRGKRLVAREQIEHTLDLLMKDSAIAKEIKAKSVKVGLLAYRVKDEDLFKNIPKQIQREFAAWQAMEKEIETRMLTFPMAYGFSFETLRYPNIYVW